MEESSRVVNTEGTVVKHMLDGTIQVNKRLFLLKASIFPVELLDFTGNAHNIQEHSICNHFISCVYYVLFVF